jgi:hypothetical protein
LIQDWSAYFWRNTYQSLAGFLFNKSTKIYIKNALYILCCLRDYFFEVHSFLFRFAISIFPLPLQKSCLKCYFSVIPWFYKLKTTVLNFHTSTTKNSSVYIFLFSAYPLTNYALFSMLFRQLLSPEASAVYAEIIVFCPWRELTGIWSYFKIWKFYMPLRQASGTFRHNCDFGFDLSTWAFSSERHNGDYGTN